MKKGTCPTRRPTPRVIPAIRPEIPVWLRDLPARVWITSRKANEPRYDWIDGKFTPYIPDKLPSNLAGVGHERIRLLCEIETSRQSASMALTWKGRRVKYLRPGVPDHRANILRRIEEGSMALRDETVQNCIAAAMKANDVRWFVRLGQALQIGRSPKTRAPDFFPDRIDRIASFLVQFWIRAPIGVENICAPLCYLTDRALMKACQDNFPTASPTLDSVRQWRKRLGLLRPDPPTFKNFAVQVDKK